MVDARIARSDGVCREEMLNAHAWMCALYTAYQDKVYAFFRYRLQDAAQAKDLTSQVFVLVMQNAAGYDPARGTERAWLFAIARNLLTDTLRRRRRGQTVALEALGEMPSPLATPEDVVEKQEDLAALLAAIRRLRPREQTVLSLKYAAELPHAEIATMLGLTEKNVGVILTRSRGKLKRALEGGLDDAE